MESVLSHVLLLFSDKPHVENRVTEWLIANRIERPYSYHITRLLKSVKRDFEDKLFAGIHADLSKAVCQKMDVLLLEESGTIPFSLIRKDIGTTSLDSVKKEIDKLVQLRNLDIPKTLIDRHSAALIDYYKQRASRENAWELKRHPDRIKYSLLAFYCVQRESEAIDGLIDLLIQIVHQIGVRAKRKVVKELVNDFIKVNGKVNILFRIAEAVHDEPDGAVRDVVFPVAGEETISNLVKEYRSDGPEYKVRVHNKIRASYGNHYRRILPHILNILKFKSNNSAHHPVLDAIKVIKKLSKSRQQYLFVDEIPIKGILRSKWMDILIETTSDGTKRINRINYEICVLQSLREQLRCKEIWVVGANRYRNPDDDLPEDFEANRQAYYDELNLPMNVDQFISDLKLKMTESLIVLNKSMPNNKKVKIKRRGNKSHIAITPYDPLPDPPHLGKVKQEVSRRWSATSLLDILKETDLRVGFTKAFSTSGTRTVTEAQEVQRRLLLALYGLGTNAGLKRIASGQHDVTYKELRHIFQRYINKDSLREGIRRIVNATMQVRVPTIWGEGTTACASDSTKFGAWDQNLVTEWHARYGGRGVMIYWHVDKQSTCIYSQLKRCSSSEVASMIEGVLRHSTELNIEQQYVDSHGQSEVGFAFCHLLGFSLLPRLKAIAKQKLYLPDGNSRGEFNNLDDILTRPIDWNLIAQQYDEMIKFATALRKRTAEPEAILRRFTRSNVKHPTYRALAELGKVIKTRFLCDYLGSEALRREIHDGLNVVERWNGTNDFIFFGKSGEIATNRVEAQEVSILSLHLLQISLVYINTLMLQQILGESDWRSLMTERDMSALTPLLHGHVNPYGLFELNMEQRLALNDFPMAA